MLLAIALIIVGFILLALSAEYVVMGCVAIANRLKIPTLIIGLTIVAFGTSIPEFFVSIKAALEGSPGIALGNVVGSNIANIALILGLAAVVNPIVSKKPVLSFDYITLFSVTVLFLFFSLLGSIGTLQGLLFILFMVAFIYYNYKHSSSSDNPNDAVSPIAKRPWWFILGVTTLGFIGIVYGSEILLDGAIDLARILGVSETIIGLTIIAVGTSLPELATTVMAAVRKQNDVALGNIVGSNIWNILFIIGTTSTFVDINVPMQLMRYDIWIMMFITMIFLLFIGLRSKISRRGGFFLISLYIIYVTTQILIAQGIFNII